MNGHFQNRTAIVTGAASGIGQAAALELARRGVRGLGLADRSSAVEEVAVKVNAVAGRSVAQNFIGDTTDGNFRSRVYEQMQAKFGLVTLCVPAAGITRDALAVKVDKATRQITIYPEELFRQVVEVNLIAPVYWVLEMVGRIAQDRQRRGLGRWEPSEEIQGSAVFIGSVSSQGNKGQIAYAATKRGLEGAARTLAKEAIWHGVRCSVIHPGFTDTPMVRKMGQDMIDKNILPYTELRRLIRPEEIASAICFMIENPAVTGEVWADAGWHPSA